MKVIGSLFITLILVIGLAACGGGSSNSSSQSGSSNSSDGSNNTTSTEVDAQAAKKIFSNATCISCHGENLQGGVGPALKHVGSRMSKQEILKQIKNGGGGMPGNLLKGEPKKAKKVATWLASLK